MAAKTFYFSNTPIAGSNLAIYEQQLIPQGGLGILSLFPSVVGDTVNDYADYGDPHFNDAGYPTNLAVKPAAISANRINGKFDAGDWTVAITHALIIGGVPASYQAHLVIRFFAITALTAPGIAAARLLTPTVFSGTIATISTNSDGISIVTATMPQVNLNNEYLVVDLAWRLDVRILVNGLVSPPRMDSSSYITTSNFTPNPDVSCSQPGLHSAERYSYITPAGTEYPLDVPRSRVVISSEGEGLPPINYLTQRGPFQDGVNLIDEFLQPRIVQLIVRHNYRSRNAYQAGRQTLVGILDPHLQLTEGGRTPGTLRKYLLDGSRRDLACMPIQGPNFAPRGSEWQEWSYQEALRFQGFDPVYINPVQHTQAFAKQGSELVGPMTGPIIGTTLDSIVTVNYLGTWRSYPVFTVLGPALAIQIENLTTSEQIFINYVLEAGRTLTISLVQGNKAITLDDGTNLMGYVSSDSDLAEWHLTENNQGVNVLHARVPGAGSTSLVTTYWYDKFLGI